MSYRNIHPPIPGRHTHLSAQLVYSINRSTTVTTGNDHLSVNDSDIKLLTFPLQVSQLTTLHPLVNLLIEAYCTNKNSGLLTLHGAESHDTLEVLLQTGYSQLHSLRLLCTITNGGAL